MLHLGRGNHQVLVSVHGLPTTISTNDKDYPDFIQSGRYQIEATGSKKQCDEVKEQLLEQFTEE